MSTTFFGFGVAPSMFPASCGITKVALTPEAAQAIIEEGISPCLNPSHKASIDAMTIRFGIVCPIPDRAATIKLEAGDRLLVMGISGLPRLEGRHEYTEAEVASARFDFSLWTVTEG